MWIFTALLKAITGKDNYKELMEKQETFSEETKE